MRTWLLATLVLLAGCAENTPDAPDVAVEDEPEPAIISKVTYHNETGSTTGLTVDPAPPIVGGAQTHSLEIPIGTTRFDAFLAWSDPVSQLEMTIAELDSATAAQEGLITVTAMDPAPGPYTAYIRTDAGVLVEYELSLRFSPDPDASAFLAAEATIPPGAFFEINLQNDNGTRLHWDWTSTTDSAFNLHTHFDGEVQYEVELTATAHADHYDVVRTGGHSLMWENPGNTPQTVSYRVWGAFTVDSYFPPR